MQDLFRKVTPTPLRQAGRRAVSEMAKFRSALPLLKVRCLPHFGLNFAERAELVRRFRSINESIDCAHTHQEMLSMFNAILSLPRGLEGCIVEAGCFKGGSTTKLSLAAHLAGRRLIVFDSFEGLPETTSAGERNIFGGAAGCTRGQYRGALEEVKENVRCFGHIELCEFVKGWFEDTLPLFHCTIAVAFIDVDLASSTRTCLRYFYPLMAPGGIVFSHDGHLPPCIEVFKDRDFWRGMLGAEPPQVQGLGHQKLIWFTKPRY